jgi:hypothetical protein
MDEWGNAPTFCIEPVLAALPCAGVKPYRCEISLIGSDYDPCDTFVMLPHSRKRFSCLGYISVPPRLVFGYVISDGTSVTDDNGIGRISVLLISAITAVFVCRYTTACPNEYKQF